MPIARTFPKCIVIKQKRRTKYKTRDPNLPDVPVPSDFGYQMNFVPTLRGVEAPANTPDAILSVLEDAFRKAAKEAGFVAIAKKRKMVSVDIGRKQFADAIADAYPNIARYRSMLKK